MTNTEAEILLVEDNPQDAELTLYALEKNKFAHGIVIARDRSGRYWLSLNERALAPPASLS